MSEFSAPEVRVLGVLMEKAVTTPDQYPLSLNALVLGCNQKTSRDPLTDYDEETVEGALDELRDRRLALRVDMAGSRVARFRHQLETRWELSPAEYALLCVLLLRGPQTLGQLRQRTERLHAFRDLDEVRATLDGMKARALEPHVLVQELPRRPGSKELRYAHVFLPLDASALEGGGESGSGEATSPAPALTPSPRDLEIARLKERVDALENELAGLRDSFEAFKAQF